MLVTFFPTYYQNLEVQGKKSQKAFDYIFKKN